MRPVVLAVLMLLAVFVPLASAQVIFICQADLRGNEVVPPTGSSGTAVFHADYSYFVLETDAYPNGELRGPLQCYLLPVQAKSWGAIRAMYR